MQIETMDLMSENALTEIVQSAFLDTGSQIRRSPLLATLRVARVR